MIFKKIVKKLTDGLKEITELEIFEIDFNQ